MDALLQRAQGLRILRYKYPCFVG